MMRVINCVNLPKLVLVGALMTLALLGRNVFADDPLDSIAIDPNAQIALRQNVTITAGQTKCSSAYAKDPGMFAIDFAVQPDGAQLGLLLLDGQQVQELNQGNGLTGTPLIRLMISGVASDTAMLPQAGMYWVCFVNRGNSDIDLEVRASFRPVN